MEQLQIFIVFLLKGIVHLNIQILMPFFFLFKKKYSEKCYSSIKWTLMVN